jgi:hypothetical protein
MHTLIEYEITSNCTCAYFDEDEELIESDHCLGCFDDAKNDLDHNLGLWITANNFEDDTLIKVSGTGIGWRRLAGYKTATASKAIEALFIENGDFTIRYSLTEGNKTLTATRYSHDEPVGTGLFTFEAVTELPCVECGDPVNAYVYTDELGLCVPCSNDYWSHGEDN